MNEYSLGFTHYSSLDLVSGLLQREFSYVAGVDKISQGSCATGTNIRKLPSLPHVHRHWRPRIFEWFYKIVDNFLLERGIVAIAMDYVDRYLEAKESEPNQEAMTAHQYQLIAMTSLYVAVKLHGGNDHGNETSPWEIKRKTFDIKEFVKLSRGEFGCEDIFHMEILLLKNLKWKMNPVTVMCCVDAFMRLVPAPGHLYPQMEERDLKRLRLGHTVLHDLARYLVELAICIDGITPYFETNRSGYFVNSLAPSTVAYAGVLLAMDMMTVSAITERTREVFQERLEKAQAVMVDREALFTHYEQIYMRFVPNNIEILKLKKLIHRSFNPSLVLEPPSGGDTFQTNAGFHPFKVAHAAGMFSACFSQNAGDDIQPPSPISPIEEHERAMI